MRPSRAADLARHMNSHRTGNQMLFGENLVKQPAFVQLAKDRPSAVRIVGTLAGANTLMDQVLFIGTYPGLSHQMIDYEMDTIKEFVGRYS